MREFTDDDARRMAAIFGEGLDAQLRNEEYLASRGAGNAETLAMVRRAVAVRDADIKRGQS